MLKNQWSKKEIEDSEYEIHHRALSEEYSFFEAVKDGNIEAVSKNLKEEAFTNPDIILLLPLHWSHGIALTAAWKQSRPTV